MSFIYEHHLSEMLSLQEKNYNSVTEIAIHQTTKQVTINFGALVSRNACVCVFSEYKKSMLVCLWQQKVMELTLSGHRCCSPASGFIFFLFFFFKQQRVERKLRAKNTKILTTSRSSSAGTEAVCVCIGR